MKVKMAKRFGYALTWLLFACCFAYLVAYVVIIQHAFKYTNQTKLDVANPTALVLGNRATVKGTPNVCMTGRIDKAMSLLTQYGGNTLLVSGGIDPVEQSFESQVMANYALSNGFKGQLLQERQSTTTSENLRYSAAMLAALQVKNVIVVLEPHHLLRAKLLARAQGMSKAFDLHFVAAKTECWNTQGVFATGALREPFALIKNLFQGLYFASSY
jgi:uncharacterized SAM-binding protein YcdF (DUF218 family)